MAISTQVMQQLEYISMFTGECNAGFNLTRHEVERAQALCEQAKAWLVLDNTYEHFVYGDERHTCIAAPNVINIFSFSKAYGMMGWRVGYLAYPGESQCPGLGAQILKVQDTIPICPSQLSQMVALAALQEGREWVSARVKELQGMPHLLIASHVAAACICSRCSHASLVPVWRRTNNVAGIVTT
jgi:aromatic aminotransferase